MEYKYFINIYFTTMHPNGCSIIYRRHLQQQTQSPCSPRQIKIKFAARTFRADFHFPISYIPLSGFWKYKYGEADLNS